MKKNAWSTIVKTNICSQSLQSLKDECNEKKIASNLTPYNMLTIQEYLLHHRETSMSLSVVMTFQVAL